MEIKFCDLPAAAVCTPKPPHLQSVLAVKPAPSFQVSTETGQLPPPPVTGHHRGSILLSLRRNSGQTKLSACKSKRQ